MASVFSRYFCFTALFIIATQMLVGCSNSSTNDTDVSNSSSEPVAVTDTLLPVQLKLELVPDKTVRLSWEPSEGAQSYRILENPDGASGFNPVSDYLDASTLAFDHRVALYKIVNARYMVQSCNDTSCVDSEEQSISGSLASAVGYFKPDLTDSPSQFGRNVSLSSDGSTLAISSYTTGFIDVFGFPQDGTADVYVYSLHAGEWIQEDKLTARIDGGRQRIIGPVSLALSANGDTLAVGGIYRDSPNPLRFEDVVYIFDRSNDGWQQTAYVSSDENTSVSLFGDAISLSGDGNTLAIGAHGESTNLIGVNSTENPQTSSDSGAAYIFTRTNGTWKKQAHIKASNTDPTDAGETMEGTEGDKFGSSISLSQDGRTLAVGARSESGASTGINGDQFDFSSLFAGAVYIFELRDGIWQQQAYVKASNTRARHTFGWSVSLSATGNTLAVGAIGENSSATGVNGNQDDASAHSAGAIYVYERSNNLWQQQAYLKASNTNQADSFGRAVSLSADGSLLAASATFEDSSGVGVNGLQHELSAMESGAVYLFERNSGDWQQLAYLKASNTETADNFGAAISLSGDGLTLAVTATGEDSAATNLNGDQNDNSATDSGAVYLY